MKLQCWKMETAWTLFYVWLCPDLLTKFKKWKQTITRIADDSKSQIRANLYNEGVQVCTAFTTDADGHDRPEGHQRKTPASCRQYLRHFRVLSPDPLLFTLISFWPSCLPGLAHYHETVNPCILHILHILRIRRITSTLATAWERSRFQWFFFMRLQLWLGCNDLTLFRV